MAYIVMVNTRDSTQGVVKIRDITKHTAINRQGLAGARTLALDKLEKEVVVPKEFKHPRRQDILRRPVGPLLRTDTANRGFLSY